MKKLLLLLTLSLFSALQLQSSTKDSLPRARQKILTKTKRRASSVSAIVKTIKSGDSTGIVIGKPSRIKEQSMSSGLFEFPHALNTAKKIDMFWQCAKTYFKDELIGTVIAFPSDKLSVLKNDYITRTIENKKNLKAILEEAETCNAHFVFLALKCYRKEKVALFFKEIASIFEAALIKALVPKAELDAVEIAVDVLESLSGKKIDIDF